MSIKPPNVIRRVAISLPLASASAVVAGCGSSVSTPSASVASPPQTMQAVTTASKATTLAATPTGPPDFVLIGNTSQGDKVKVEGRFGPPIPASGSDVTLSGCPEPSDDGRAIVVPMIHIHPKSHSLNRIGPSKLRSRSQRHTSGNAQQWARA